MCFSASDDTLAPPGQHVVTIWGQWYPYALADGADWDALADDEAQRLVAAVDRYAPGFADSVQRLYVQTPLALERELSLPRGNVMHVEMGLASMFGFRPDAGAVRLPGARACPASTWPAPPPTPAAGSRATPGRTAARVLLADRRPARARAAAAGGLRRVAPPAPGTGRDRRDVRRPASGRPLRRVPLVLAALLVLTAIAYPLTTGAGRDAVSWTIVLLGVGAVGGARRGSAAARAPAEGVLVLVAAVAVAFEAVGLATGFPYGRYTYSDALGPDPARRAVPGAAGLADDGLAELAAGRAAGPAGPRATAAASGSPSAAGVFAAWDVVLDPQMVQAGYWTWAHPRPGLPGIGTVPLTNLAGWLLAGLVLMTLLDLLVDRTAVPGSRGSATPRRCSRWAG